jgi:hypothetical protein
MHFTASFVALGSPTTLSPKMKHRDGVKNVKRVGEKRASHTPSLGTRAKTLQFVTMKRSLQMTQEFHQRTPTENTISNLKRFRVFLEQFDVSPDGTKTQLHEPVRYRFDLFFSNAHCLEGCKACLEGCCLEGCKACNESMIPCTPPPCVLLRGWDGTTGPTGTEVECKGNRKTVTLQVGHTVSSYEWRAHRLPREKKAVFPRFRLRVAPVDEVLAATHPCLTVFGPEFKVVTKLTTPQPMAQPLTLFAFSGSVSDSSSAAATASVGTSQSLHPEQLLSDTADAESAPSARNRTVDQRMSGSSPVAEAGQAADEATIEQLLRDTADPLPIAPGEWQGPLLIASGEWQGQEADPEAELVPLSRQRGEPSSEDRSPTKRRASSSTDTSSRECPSLAAPFLEEPIAEAEGEAVLDHLFSADEFANMFSVLDTELSLSGPMFGGNSSTSTEPTASLATTTVSTASFAPSTITTTSVTARNFSTTTTVAATTDATAHSPELDGGAYRSLSTAATPPLMEEVLSTAELSSRVAVQNQIIGALMRQRGELMNQLTEIKSDRPPTTNLPRGL